MVAVTGCATSQVGGVTMHSFLQLPRRKGALKRLKGDAVARLQHEPDLPFGGVTIIMDPTADLCCSACAGCARVCHTDIPRPRQVEEGGSDYYHAGARGG